MNGQPRGSEDVKSSNGTTQQLHAATKHYSIGDLAREFGVTLRTLRFYEDRGLLSPERDGLARVYDSHNRARLSMILKGKQLGFTLAEIRAMLAEEKGSETGAELNLTLQKITDQISHLEAQKAEIEGALNVLRSKREGLAREIRNA